MNTIGIDHDLDRLLPAPLVGCAGCTSSFAVGVNKEAMNRFEKIKRDSNLQVRRKTVCF